MQSYLARFVFAIAGVALSVPSAQASGVFDGPAELPRATVVSTLAKTPAPGSHVTVRAGDNLQTALNNAHCGDTIELQAGAVFTGLFDLPTKSCDDNHWIVIRTDAADSLPSEGERVNPCYAGIATLVGRPAYACGNPQNVMARVENPNPVDGPFILQKGANHYRLIGLEVTRSAGVHDAPVLLTVEPKGVADHIVIDRCWFHGTVRDETRLGVSLRGMSQAAVVDSYFSDFHCNEYGMCTDAHAIGGGTGDHQDGPFKISHNFLEASGEAVMFGGGSATLTPADIEITRNHFFKPWQWMPGTPGQVKGLNGKSFATKNHLELKNATRVLVEANLMENNWGGFTQAGYALLLSPKNQHTRHGNVCPKCQVTDVTIRYTRISHSGSGIQLETSISGNGGNGAPALAGQRWSIHDVVIDDISKNYFGQGNVFIIANGWPRNPVNTITINHVTAFPDAGAHLLMIGNSIKDPDMFGLVFTNNLVATGQYPVWSSGGGWESCAYHGTPEMKIQKCFKTSTFKNNALIGTPDAFPPSDWPSGNLFPATVDAVKFVQYDSGGDGDYTLQSSSPYKNKGTDGKDLGADIAGLNAALSDVE
ncbi:MAG: hypothetical protein HY010_03320 [Acidobacteria bacterium]|nr:hypothetical protein [Acidobacteriota bacterium]